MSNYNNDGNFDLTFSDNPPMQVRFSNRSPSLLKADFKQSYSVPYNYNDLYNKPSVNGTKLEGSLSLPDIDLRAVYYDTTEHWDEKTSLVSEEGALYIYSDYRIVDNVAIPSIKVGDGITLLSECQFVTGSNSELVDELTKGNVGDVLISTGGGISWVAPAVDFEGDNTRPMSAAGVYMQIGNINALLETI